VEARQYTSGIKKMRPLIGIHFHAPSAPIFMKFLYRRTAFPLEFLCTAGPLTGLETPACARWLRSIHSAGADKMLDFVMLAIGLGFFVLAVGYTYACDHL
jgi:hypothetical protein